MSELLLSSLGLVPYLQAWKLQQRLRDLVALGKISSTILFLEHPPTITLGRHGKESNLLLSPQELKEKGIEFYNVDRGGDITYHGPGQLVAYFVLPVGPIGVKRFVWLLEEAILRFLDSLGLKGQRIEGAPGVWIQDKKICSIGIAVKGGITQHGLALNVENDLSYFSFINPCGQANLPITSLAEELPERISLPGVEKKFIPILSEVFSRKIIQVSPLDLFKKIEESF